jgi:chromosome segregation ATPase
MNRETRLPRAQTISQSFSIRIPKSLLTTYERQLMGNSNEDRSIEQLKEQYEKLNRRKIQTETQLATANAQLEELLQEAESEFGTSDVAELKKKLAKMEDENSKNRREYQTLLDKIEADLAAIEKANSDSPSTEAAPDE